MTQKTFATAALSAALALASTFALAQSSPATLTIHPDKSLHPVSPSLYGLMTEEINYSYDGGLYAELVRNRTFFDRWEGVLNWYLIERGNSSATMEIDHKTGPSQALDRSLLVNIAKADAESPAGVFNEGYWGIALRPETTYTGSLWAKVDAANMGPLTIALVSNKTGEAVACTQIDALSTGWKQYSYSLKTGALEPSADYHLALTVTHPGKLWMQLVSLFPPTYKDRPNGFRKDLMAKMAEMRPAFLRFPGGNYLEGDHINERFEWKKTLGPWVDRPTHPSPWGYQSTDGMGLLEFLEWCEDLKMQPLLAVYAGYSMKQEHVDAGPALEPYIQDALDEIEYVTGPADSKWGSVRARDGHPEPFKLSYVEIGNEDFFDKSGSYEGRYAAFYKAIKAKYPQLQLISTMPVKNMKADMQDDHFYVRASVNFNDATHYDKTDRNGPKIFVGEWATREGSPTPDFGAALGDAAWMTGLERNSDVVVMAAYAPLLVNVNPGGMQWDTDLIGYDAMKSYGSPSYYAQVLFAKYRGDKVLDSKFEAAPTRVFYSANSTADGKKLYLKLVNGNTTAQPIKIELPGAKPSVVAKVVSLSAPSTQTTNSMADPERVVPVESKLEGVSSSFTYTLPANTIEVIEISLQ